MAMSTPAKPRLGRGLDALLPVANSADALSQRPTRLPIEEVHPNRSQPRSRFETAALEELAQSIREVGVLEPILVRRRQAGGFEIIAGERRWRAAQKASLRDVPVHFHDFDDRKAFEAALIENLQRQDLNPVEVARAFERLTTAHGHSQESLAQLTGKDRSTVANALRLLKLPKDVLEMVEQGQLSEGHGRAILTAGDAAAMRGLAHQVLSKNLSVRETERRARKRSKDPNVSANVLRDSAPKSANVRDLETRIAQRLGTSVRIDDVNGRGTLTIQYSDYDTLDRILEQIMG